LGEDSKTRSATRRLGENGIFLDEIGEFIDAVIYERSLGWRPTRELG
jgi:hypothetical protein